MNEPVSEYERERREKLDCLRQLGVDPFGQRTANIAPLADTKASYKPEMGHDAGPTVTAAGRVMFLKRFGKLAFATLRDETGDLQVALDKKRLPEQDWQIQELIDLGDQIVVTGNLGQTKTKETTIWSTSLSMASKSLLPPPGKFHGLEDVEQRYRQRYVDLWANPEVMKLAKLRIRIMEEIRSYLRGLGYAEVETPMMQIMHGGANARPFVTHANALDIPLYMRIAPELYLKRLLVGGMRKIFELNRNFRNEGISPRHNPEFTMLEAYEAFGNWETMADMVEGLICHLAQTLLGTLEIKHRDPKGMKAIDVYLASRSKANLENICIARLDLIQTRPDLWSLLEVSDHERDAIATASEGYERLQSGFDAFVIDTDKELAGKTTDEVRQHLASKFVVKIIDLTRPWRRVSLVEAVKKKTGWSFNKCSVVDDAPEIYHRILAERVISRGSNLFSELQAMLERVKSEVRDDPEALYRLNSEIKRNSDEEAAAREALALNVLNCIETDGRLPELVRAIRENPKLLLMFGVVLQLDSLGRLSPAEQLQDIYEKHVEPALIDPTFVTHIPSVIIPLAKENKEDPFFADVYELAINGVEISPGYTELNDPDVQAKHFAHQVGDKEEQQKVDTDFLNALMHGMPPAGGMGLGVDRLIMMLTGAESIRDVILFPLMKPQA